MDSIFCRTAIVSRGISVSQFMCILYVLVIEISPFICSVKHSVLQKYANKPLDLYQFLLILNASENSKQQQNKKWQNKKR